MIVFELEDYSGKIDVVIFDLINITNIATIAKIKRSLERATKLVRLSLRIAENKSRLLTEV